jgi:hypothetical protein
MKTHTQDKYGEPLPGNMSGTDSERNALFMAIANELAESNRLNRLVLSKQYYYDDGDQRDHLLYSKEELENQVKI